jgi:hypothetical protein
MRGNETRIDQSDNKQTTAPTAFKHRTEESQSICQQATRTPAPRAFKHRTEESQSICQQATRTQAPKAFKQKPKCEQNQTSAMVT